MFLYVFNSLAVSKTTVEWPPAPKINKLSFIRLIYIYSFEPLKGSIETNFEELTESPVKTFTNVFRNI